MIRSNGACTASRSAAEALPGTCACTAARRGATCAHPQAVARHQQTIGLEIVGVGLALCEVALRQKDVGGQDVGRMCMLLLAAVSGRAGKRSEGHDAELLPAVGWPAVAALTNTNSLMIDFIFCRNLGFYGRVVHGVGSDQTARSGKVPSWRRRALASKQHLPPKRALARSPAVSPPGRLPPLPGQIAPALTATNSAIPRIRSWAGRRMAADAGWIGMAASARGGTGLRPVSARNIHYRHSEHTLKAGQRHSTQAARGKIFTPLAAKTVATV